MINLDTLLSAIQRQETDTRRLLVEAQHVSLELQEPRLLGKHIPGWSAWSDVIRTAEALLRQVERDLRVLERHARSVFNDMPWCAACDHDCCSEPWPCIEIRDLAHAYAIPTEDPQP